jgi:small subunit ribosomal protein S17
MNDTATTEPKQRTLTATKIGTVVSDKADKTRVVAVAYQQKHPKYGKFLHRDAKFMAHDEKNESRTGDKVEIAGCRPLSKNKSWRIVRIVEEGVRHED